MKVVLNEVNDLYLTDFGSGEFEVVSQNPGLHFSAIQMFITSLGLCTYSVLQSYARNIDVDDSDIRINIRWDYADDPKRISDIAMDITWPGVPESRLAAAKRAASHCTIHHTLEIPPTVRTEINTG